jgi:Icc-related predicted phosphoesterase
MKITCTSDLHGFYPQLEHGDLLLIGGDLTAKHSQYEFEEFGNWLDYQPFDLKVVIAGNHDSFLENNPDFFRGLPNVVYLCDSGTEFQGLKIWGSPWTLSFPGINPHCCAFTCKNEEELQKKWSLIPSDTDILMTHSPPYGILDKLINGQHVGSKTLQMAIFTRLNPRLFICGHIHESYGKEPPGGILENAFNVSYVNERYQPINSPITITIP